MEELRYRTKSFVEGLTQEDVDNWRNSPITKKLFEQIEEFNKFYEGKHNLFVGIQWGKEEKGIIHFFIS